MAPRKKVPMTPAIRVLKQAGVAFAHHVYAYEARGGTRRSSQELGVEEHVVIKTIVMEDASRKPFIVLMHGDRQVSVRQLGRVLQQRTVRLCTPEVAHRHTGYRVGGTSPFGTRKALPVYVEASVMALETLYINGGRRGLLVSMTPAALASVLRPTTVHCAV